MADLVQLRDGTEAWVLPLLHSDRDLLAEEFQKLSAQTRHQRFLSPVMELSDALLSVLVDEVDGEDHVALVLFAESGEDSHTFEPVAIGRMVRYPEVPDSADLAVTVKDAWQGRGVASALLPVLVAHRPVGVTHVLTEVAKDNPASLAMLQRLGQMTVCPNGEYAHDVRVDLAGDCTKEPLVETTSERLHPVLADSSRARLRGRDGICPWLR